MPTLTFLLPKAKNASCSPLRMLQSPQWWKSQLCYCDCVLHNYAFCQQGRECDLQKVLTLILKKTLCVLMRMAGTQKEHYVDKSTEGSPNLHPIDVEPRDDLQSLAPSQILDGVLIAMLWCKVYWWIFMALIDTHISFSWCKSETSHESDFKYNPKSEKVGTVWKGK